jgi:hypothetical protein
MIGGDTITASTTLNGNVGPCATGITIGASNILSDLNANCGTNQWHGNQGPPANPACTLNP